MEDSKIITVFHIVIAGFLIYLGLAGLFTGEIDSFGMVRGRGQYVNYNSNPFEYCFQVLFCLGTGFAVAWKIYKGR